MSTPQEQNRKEDFFHYEKLGLKYVGIWRTKDDSVGYKIYSSVIIYMFTCAYYVILFFDVVTENFYDVIDSWVVFIGFSIDDDTHLIDEGKLINFVNDHISVLKLTDEVSAVYSKIILITFLGVMSTNCLEIYLISALPVKDMSSVTLFLEVLAVCLPFFNLCRCGQH
ncbi:hypothetical protein FQR65_LT06948 [Abscondita terminalis]|nr:hypothetical protein FQR65_LT06948 [Abscondita terminalis]